MSVKASATPSLGPWGVHRIPDHGGLDVDVGPLSLRLAQESGEIRVAVVEGGRRENGGSERDLDWTRWAPADWTGEIELTPVFADRPLVVQPEDAFWLLAGAEARIYVRVPLWVRILAVGTVHTTLVTIPTVESSDTWWGSVEEGELCYWLQTHARRKVTEDLFAHHLAICPLQLVNRSTDDLNVDKIAIRVEYLSLYAHAGRSIWADETSVRYSGESEGSRIDVSGSAPAEAPGAELLAPPRTQMARGFRARTFARLRSIQGWI
jgi:hypothetical protein